jgi:hypothetical protein
MGTGPGTILAGRLAGDALAPIIACEDGGPEGGGSLRSTGGRALRRIGSLGESSATARQLMLVAMEVASREVKTYLATQGGVKGL